MEINNNEIRENARLSLKGNWKVAIVSSLVYSIVSIIGDFIPESSSIWFSILTTISNALLIFGYTAIMLHIVRGEDAEFSEIFSECKRFWKGLGMTIVVNIYIGLWTLLLVVPGIIASIKYSMTFYIWVDNPKIGIDEAINKSIEMTDGHKMDIFKLYLSFIGWIVLSLVPSFVVWFWFKEYALGIMSLGMIFVSPYIEVSMGTFYNTLVKERGSQLTLGE
ncbi:membrane protein [Clostridium gelidum]|uniref:Membrane protein n=1 Tax=Clostridium gelidum TaxID=704125 RepID=A0ABM7T6V0_9CLOT|nr:DUF975 family protein [Clostridium gelidum]BCZ47742.1 membrane protein [Clostridium gelidum]